MSTNISSAWVERPHIRGEERERQSENRRNFLGVSKPPVCPVMESTGISLMRNCELLQDGYICSADDCTSCKLEKVTSYTCTGETCFAIKTAKTNWYEAKSRCRLQGSKLVKTKPESESIVAEAIKIRTKEYHKDLTVPPLFFWIGKVDNEQRENESRECVIMTKHGKLDVSCKTKHSAICIKKAKRKCSFPQGGLELNPSSSGQTRQRYWINLRRVTWTTWRNHIPNLKISQEANSNCILVSKASYVARPCFSARKGYVCKTKRCAHCNHRRCVRVNSSCFSLNCDVMNWFVARKMCKSADGILPKFLPKDVEKMLADLISREQSACTEYWIGVSREDWFTEKADRHDETDLLPVNEAKWVHEQMMEYPLAECVTAKLIQDQWLWYPTPCNEKHSFICNVQSVTQKDESKSHRVVVSYALVAGIAVALAFLLSIGVTCCLIIRKKGGANKQQNLPEKRRHASTCNEAQSLTLRDSVSPVYEEIENHEDLASRPAHDMEESASDGSMDDNGREVHYENSKNFNGYMAPP